MDGSGGSLRAATDTDRTVLPEDRAKRRAATYAAGDDAAHLLPTELVRPERADGRRDAL